MNLFLPFLVAGLFFGFIVFLLVCVVSLVASTFRLKKIEFVWFLITHFLFLAIYYVYMLLRVFFPLPIVYSGLLVQGAIFSFLGFLIKGFYRGKKSKAKLLIVACLILATLSISFGFVQDYGGGEWIDFARVFRTFCTHGEIIITMGWQGSIAIRMYINLKNEPIVPHVKARYLLFGTACLVLILMSVSDIIGTPMNVYLGIDYDWTVLLITSLVFVSSVLNYLAWVMPPAFKKYLDKRFNREQVEETSLSEEEIMKVLSNDVKEGPGNSRVEGDGGEPA